MNRLSVFVANPVNTLDSREVAEMISKRHDNLLRDINGYVEILSNSTPLKFEVSEFFTPDTYQDSTGRTLPCYQLTKMGCEMVANKMTGEKGVLFTAAYVKRFNEMEEANGIKVPKTFKEALLLALEQQEKIEQLEAAVDYKEKVIFGLVDEIDLASKRQILNQVMKKKGCNYKERWNLLYHHFEMKYHTNLNVKLENYNKTHSPKLKNKLAYIDQVLNKIPELYEIAAKLFENDVKELVNEVYSLV